MRHRGHSSWQSPWSTLPATARLLQGREGVDQMPEERGS